MKPRILHISARADHSGGPRHLHDLVRGGLADYAGLFIACPREQPFWDRYARLVVAGHMLEIPHRRFTPSAFAALRRLVNQQQINLIHSHGRGAGVYGRLLAQVCGVPAVHTFHGFHPGSLPLRIAEERLLARWSTRLVAVSESEAARLRLHNIARREEQLVVIPNAVEVPAILRQNPNEVSQIVGIMRLAAEKHPAFFIEVTKSLPARYADIGVTVAGGGPLRDELLRQSAAAHGAVAFPGELDEPRDLLAKASGIYLASSRAEGLSLAMLDAMALGVPVVASEVDGHTDLIRQDETGLLYPFGDAASAARQIERLIEDPKLRHRIVTAAYEYVRQHHSLGPSIQKLVALYEDALS